MTLALDTDALRTERLNRRLARFAPIDSTLNGLGFGFVSPLIRALLGENPGANMREFGRMVGIPLASILLFLALWAHLAPKVETSLGAVPGPAQVWEQAVILHADAVREGEKEAAFHVRQEERNAALRG